MLGSSVLGIGFRALWVYGFGSRVRVRPIGVLLGAKLSQDPYLAVFVIRTVVQEVLHHEYIIYHTPRPYSLS